MRDHKKKTKVLSMAMASSMILSLCPVSVLAAETSGPVKDGTYQTSSRVKDSEEEGWAEYDISVELKVENGKIAGLTVVPGEICDSKSEECFTWAKEGRKKKGVDYPGYDSLVGQEASEATVNGWDAVSGATCTSDAVKEAMLSALQSASTEEEGSKPPTGETENGTGGNEGSNQGGTTQETYKYVYAGISWAEYWAAEGVQAAGDASTSSLVDTKGESDKGAFDTVTRATTNHGLHRGSFQCMAKIYLEDGKTIDVSYYTAATEGFDTEGNPFSYSKDQIERYEVTGLKYVPVKVAAKDYEAFCKKYPVVENGGELSGGFTEKNLKAYIGLKANVTENTNGLKEVVKGENGTFCFKTRTKGNESGIQGEALKTAPSAEEVGLEVQEANGSYGEFLRVDLKGNYGDLGSKMQTVTWTYYGNDSNRTTPLAVYGTKFAADNWMHKLNGVQLGLTESARCTLPEGTDGTGYWNLTITAMGYQDVTYPFEAKAENIVKDDDDSVQTTKALEAAIKAAEALNEEVYTASTWADLQKELEEAREELASPHTQSSVDEATAHLNSAIQALKTEYVLMNIPYARFYEEETDQNVIQVDAFTSATKNKPRTGDLAGGSYHNNAEGTEISGAIFPVKVGDIDLSGYEQITDKSSVDITVTNKGQTSTTTYTGKEALFESEDYSWYALYEVPSYYKEVTVDGEELKFGETQGEHTTLAEGIEAKFTTETGYGDYQLDLKGLRGILNAAGDGSDVQVNGVIVQTTDGTGYGMRHMENIWIVEKLAWCTGFTEAVHNCPTSSAHYASMMGKTISQVTYYTNKGIYDIPVDNIYVPVKFSYTASVENAPVTAGNTTMKIEGLPSDYDAEYTVYEPAKAREASSETGFSYKVENGVISFENAPKGKYTLEITDKKGKYASITTEFILYTENMPAAYNENEAAPALVKAEGATDEEFADYIGNITTVTVNGTAYAATGRKPVVIVKEDGTIDTTAAPFAEGDTFEITVASTGYLDRTFTYVKQTKTGDDDSQQGDNGNKPSGDTGNSGTGNGQNNTNQNGNSGNGQAQNNTGQNGNARTQGVRTGDTSNAGGWLAAFAVSLSAGVGAIVLKRKKRA